MIAGNIDESEKLEGERPGTKRLYKWPLSEAEAYLRAIGRL